STPFASCLGSPHTTGWHRSGGVCREGDAECKSRIRRVAARWRLALLPALLPPLLPVLLAMLLPALALPATAVHVPAVTLTAPGVRHPAVARSRRFPAAGTPGIAPALPEPGAADPDIAGARRDTDHLVPGRGWLHLAHHDTRPVVAGFGRDDTT